MKCDSNVQSRRSTDAVCPPPAWCFSVLAREDVRVHRSRIALTRHWRRDDSRVRPNPTTARQVCGERMFGGIGDDDRRPPALWKHREGLRRFYRTSDCAVRKRLLQPSNRQLRGYAASLFRARWAQTTSGSTGVSRTPSGPNAHGSSDPAAWPVIERDRAEEPCGGAWNGERQAHRRPALEQAWVQVARTSRL